MPQAAVTCGGQVRVSSGSTIAHTGVKLSWRSDFLKPSLPTLLMTAFFVASLPVPAVVGTAMKGKVFPGCVLVPTPSRYGVTGSPKGNMAAMALAQSMTLPPPTATTASTDRGPDSFTAPSTVSGDG